MGKDPLRIEWTILEDERARATSAPILEMDEFARPASRLPGLDADQLAPAEQISAASRGELRLAALIVVLFLLLAGVWTWYREVRQATMTSDLQATIAQEVGAPQTGGTLSAQPSTKQLPAGQAAQPLLHPKSSALAINTGYQSDAQIDGLHRIGNRVMAHVTVSYLMSQGVVLPFRETHFYRQTAGGWQRIEADAALMGSWQTLETQYFTIRYRRVDAGAVAEAAPRLDQLYAKLRRDLGPPLAGATQKITLEFITDELVDGYRLGFATRTITLPSPVVLSVPAEISTASSLYEAVVYPLARLALLETIDPHSLEWKQVVVLWRSLIDALPLWALWDNAEPLAAQRHDVVRWLYHNAQVNEPGTIKALPNAYAALCRNYRIWRLSPWDMSIPLTCTQVHENLTPMAFDLTMPLRLEELCCRLIEPDSMPTTSPEGDSVGGVVAMETLIEYVVATYGRESLPRLVVALGEHASWQSLIPAVFDIPADEFEAGWQNYLVHEYNISPLEGSRMSPNPP